MDKVMFLSMCMKPDIAINVMGLERTVPFDFADGLIGMMPVFDTAENAKKYSPDKEIQLIALKEVSHAHD
jgi:hypothetical protein